MQIHTEQAVFIKVFQTSPVTIQCRYTAFGYKNQCYAGTNKINAKFYGIYFYEPTVTLLRYAR